MACEERHWATYIDVSLHCQHSAIENLRIFIHQANNGRQQTVINTNEIKQL